MSMIRVKRKHVLDSSSDDEDDEAYAGEAIPGLLNDIVVTHVLRSEYFDARRSRTAPSGEPRDARRGGGNGASV